MFSCWEVKKLETIQISEAKGRILTSSLENDAYNYLANAQTNKSVVEKVVGRLIS